jgi:hypothetical protein
MELPSGVLASLCHSLPVLNAHVAKEFLALAAVLQSTLTHAREISTESHKTIDSTATKRIKEAVAMLKGILFRSQSMSELVEISHSRMVEILRHLNVSRVPLQRLSKMRSHLRTMTVLSRIECERITSDSVDLSSLSRDIDTLGGEVQRHLEGIADDSSRLSELLQKGVRRLDQFEREERQQVTDLIHHTQGVLGPMIGRLESTEATARDIDEQCMSFHRATGSIVMSLQSEDIARQRIEHVQQALQHAANALDAGGSADACARVVALQSAQLTGTRDLLAESIHSIYEGLVGLGPHISELEERTASLVRQMEQDGHSFVQAIESGLSAVSSVVKQCSASVQAAVSLIDSVLPSVEEMTKRANALEEIEASIRLISLNATITTAHLGSDGAAMAVIAHELHSIAQSSENDIHAVLGGLTAISGALTQIVNEESASGGSKMICDGDEALKKEFAGLAQSVDQWSRNMTSELNGVVKLASALRSELAQGCELAGRADDIPRLFENELPQFDEALRQLGHTRETAAATAAQNGATELLDLYSMQSERKLHAEVFDLQHNHLECVDPPPAQNQPGEFGDNIELF